MANEFWLELLNQVVESQRKKEAQSAALNAQASVRLSRLRHDLIDLDRYDLWWMLEGASASAASSRAVTLHLEANAEVVLRRLPREEWSDLRHCAESAFEVHHVRIEGDSALKLSKWASAVVDMYGVPILAAEVTPRGYLGETRGPVVELRSHHKRAVKMMQKHHAELGLRVPYPLGKSLEEWASPETERRVPLALRPDPIATVMDSFRDPILAFARAAYRRAAEAPAPPAPTGFDTVDELLQYAHDLVKGEVAMAEGLSVGAACMKALELATREFLPGDVAGEDGQSASTTDVVRRVGHHMSEHYRGKRHERFRSAIKRVVEGAHLMASGAKGLANSAKHDGSELAAVACYSSTRATVEILRSLKT